MNIILYISIYIYTHINYNGLWVAHWELQGNLGAKFFTEPSCRMPWRHGTCRPSVPYSSFPGRHRLTWVLTQKSWCHLAWGTTNAFWRGGQPAPKFSAGEPALRQWLQGTNTPLWYFYDSGLDTAFHVLSCIWYTSFWGLVHCLILPLPGTRR